MLTQGEPAMQGFGCDTQWLLQLLDAQEQPPGRL